VLGAWRRISALCRRRVAKHGVTPPPPPLQVRQAHHHRPDRAAAAKALGAQQDQGGQAAGQGGRRLKPPGPAPWLAPRLVRGRLQRGRCSPLQQAMRPAAACPRRRC
jgi:hypothetical protein